MTNGPYVADSGEVGWLQGRRYGVPAGMVERATRCRLAGDWRGACAAARVDVRFDLDELRRRFGSEIAAAVERNLAAPGSSVDGLVNVGRDLTRR